MKELFSQITSLIILLGETYQKPVLFEAAKVILQTLEFLLNQSLFLQ